jgi:hypothetical protein
MLLVSDERRERERWTYLEIHPSQWLTPLHQEGETDVEMELGECVAPFRLDSSLSVRSETKRRRNETDQISVPHPDDVLDAHLAHEETVHPPECKLDELDVVLGQMRREGSCDSRSSVWARSDASEDVPSTLEHSSFMRET